MANLIERYPDFPKKGINFYCVQKLLQDPVALSHVMDQMQQQVPKHVTKLVALDARGFIFASMLSARLELGLVLIRKKGKLPGNCHEISYQKEYGQDTLCIQKSALNETDHVIIVDDVLATGGTATAAYELVAMCDASIHSFLFLLKIEGLQINDRSVLKAPIYSVFGTDDNADKVVDHHNWFQELDNVTTSSPQNLYKSMYPTIVFFHPNSKALAADFIQQSPMTRRPGTVLWSSFNDGWPDIKFENSEELKGKQIVFIMNLERCQDGFILEQLFLLLALCRQNAECLDIFIPFFAPGTMELVREEGVLANAEPMMKLISRILPCNGTKMTTTVLDIHNTCERFYLADTVTPILIDSSKFIKGLLINQDITVVFPDAGAYKRYGHHVKEYPVIVFCKTRIGNERKMMLQSSDDPQPLAQKFIIWDDLVHSGQTLIECAKALKEIYGPKIITVDVYVTHCIMENNAHLSFLTDNTIRRIYTTDSVAHKLPVLRRYPDKFYIFPCMTLFKSQDHQDRQEQKSHFVNLSSKSEIKEKALSRSLDDVFKVSTFDIKSGVSEQPIGWKEIISGAVYRQERLRRHVLNDYDLVSMESGIVRMKGDQKDVYKDVTLILIEQRKNHSRASNTHKRFILKIGAIISEQQFKEYQCWINKNNAAGKTFGDYLFSLGLCTNSKDWYAVLSPNTKSRADTLLFDLSECIVYNHPTDILRYVSQI